MASVREACKAGSRPKRIPAARHQNCEPGDLQVQADLSAPGIPGRQEPNEELQEPRCGAGRTRRRPPRGSGSPGAARASDRHRAAPSAARIASSRRRPVARASAGSTRWRRQSAARGRRRPAAPAAQRTGPMRSSRNGTIKRSLIAALIRMRALDARRDQVQIALRVGDGHAWLQAGDGLEIGGRRDCSATSPLSIGDGGTDLGEDHTCAAFRPAKACRHDVDERVRACRSTLIRVPMIAVLVP